MEIVHHHLVTSRSLNLLKLGQKKPNNLDHSDHYDFTYDTMNSLELDNTFQKHSRDTAICRSWLKAITKVVVRDSKEIW
jgi:hypothetical protein